MVKAALRLAVGLGDNLAYQGILPKSAVDELQISWKECFKPDRLEYFDHIIS